MSIIKVVGEKLKLASRWERLGAFLLDIGFLGFCQIMLWLIGLLQSIIFTDVDEYMMFGNDPATTTFFVLSILLWMYGYFLMDGREDGGFGKRLLSLKIVRLKDGEEADYKDAFVRRFAALFQPIDWLFALGKGRQRMGDKLAKTVVIKLDSPQIEIVSEDEKIDKETDLEKILENVILEITNRFSEAKQKVDASIGIEKQFQNAHDGAIAQAEKCEERATISLKAGREDLAREDLAQRNEYRQLASRYKTQWEEQKETVSHLTSLLETLQQKTHETQRERDVVIAQHRNVDAHDHLQQTLTELQNNKAFEVLKKMGQDVTEAAALAKAAAEVDFELQDVKLHHEFANYAEDGSINKDIAELKAKIT